MAAEEDFLWVPRQMESGSLRWRSSRMPHQAGDCGWVRSSPSRPTNPCPPPLQPLPTSWRLQVHRTQWSHTPVAWTQVTFQSEVEEGLAEGSWYRVYLAQVWVLRVQGVELIPKGVDRVATVMRRVLWCPPHKKTLWLTCWSRLT